MKVVFSEPVTGVDATTVTLTDAQGTAVPASVAQIGDYTWGLFPHQVFLTRGETSTARVAAAVCDFAKHCLAQALTWRFTITGTPGGWPGGYQYSAGREPATSGGAAGHRGRDGAGGAAGGRPDPTAEARRSATNVNADSAPMMGSGSQGQSATRELCTRCWHARRHVGILRVCRHRAAWKDRVSMEKGKSLL